MGSHTFSDDRASSVFSFKMSSIIAFMIILAIAVFNVQESGAWQSPQQYFTRIRKMNGNGFSLPDIEEIKDPHFRVKEPEERMILNKRDARRSHMCYANPVSCF